MLSASAPRIFYAAAVGSPKRDASSRTASVVAQFASVGSRPSWRFRTSSRAKRQHSLPIGNSLHAGMVIVADGTPEAAARLERVLTADPGTGVMRHADAGYDLAIDVARERGLDLPGITDR